MQVAEAAVAALGQKHALADLGQVGDDGLLVFLEDLGSHGHPQHDVVAILAGALPAHAGLAVLREEMLLIAKVDQRVQPLDRLGPDIAATPAVAAVRPAVFDELLAPETDAAPAARTRADMHLGKIEELHVTLSLAVAQAIVDFCRRLKRRAVRQSARDRRKVRASTVCDRARAVTSRRPVSTKPKRGKDPVRPVVAQKAACLDRHGGKHSEGMPEHDATGLGRIALPPGRSRQPVSKLPLETDKPDKTAIVADRPDPLPAPSTSAMKSSASVNP
jgi:hypothetical protein